MLIVNLAPLDQSPRTLNIVKKQLEKNKNIELLAYRPSTFIEIPCKVRYIRYFESKNIFMKFFKLIYCNIMVAFYVLTSKERNVIFVCPPIFIFFGFMSAFMVKDTVLIDWHRFNNKVTLFESFLIKMAEINSCVTEEMTTFVSRLGNAVCMPDKPIMFYERLDKTKEITKLSEKYISFKLFLENFNILKHLESMPIFLCSTSYSIEEKNDYLLEYLIKLDTRVRTPFIFIFTTKKIVDFPNLKNIFITSQFFDYNDYINLLRCADLGVNMHDIWMDYPMKCIDYISCKLPFIGANELENIERIINSDQYSIKQHETTETFQIPSEIMKWK
ncbi:hypothetical protein CWI39_2836p0010 [Hamiltosporidium magnivora]|uniref:Chitobiosyldiphosphodolichol beta-mannosyltransferase n=1 Tax=Hamiltosporidium magnivora TaxID=148818 RepID=A0A4Q9KSC2_9MICR|nr:hypothetical protein CWI39_2836p0010 [Hamiltosporidium magnivora]